MNDKKVLIIRNAEYKDFGGGERFPVFLAQSLKKCGYNSVVVSRSPSLLKFASTQGVKTMRGWWWPRQKWSGYRIILTPFYLLWQLILYFWYVYIILKTNVSVVHPQGKDDFIASTLAGKSLGKKVVWTDHADLKHVFKNLYVWYKNPIGKMVYWCALLADAVVIVSNEEKRLIFDNLHKSPKIERKVKLIYNGVADTSDLYNKEPNKRFTFGVATRLVVDKGFNEAIEAFEQFGGKYEKCQLMLIGDGPDAIKFRDKAKNNKDIIFTGHLDNPLSQMKNLDVFMHPTYHESFSIAIVEAAMLGLPIIATRVGGNPEIIEDGKTGLLVEAKDSKSLEAAMEKLYKDKALRQKLAKSARDIYVKKFNFDDIVKNQYIKLYEK